MSVLLLVSFRITYSVYSWIKLIFLFRRCVRLWGTRRPILIPVVCMCRHCTLHIVRRTLLATHMLMLMFSLPLASWLFRSYSRNFLLCLQLRSIRLIVRLMCLSIALSWLILRRPHPGVSCILCLLKNCLWLDWWVFVVLAYSTVVQPLWSTGTLRP